jgi:hypothetical protein
MKPQPDVPQAYMCSALQLLKVQACKGPALAHHVRVKAGNVGFARDTF